MVCGTGYASRVEDRGEGVNGSAVGTDGGGRCIDGTQGFLDIWEFDPAGTVGEAFVIQDQPENIQNQFPNHEGIGIADLIRQTLGAQGCGMLEGTSYRVIIGWDMASM